MISVICVYNDRETLRRFLLRDLREGDDYELILLDNTTGRFSSAAEALNHGAEMATGDTLIFAHQDVQVKPEAIRRMASCSSSLEDAGVLGAAGVAGPFRLFSCMKQGDPPVDVGRRIGAPVRVQTVDECLFAIPSGVWRRHPFDEETCSHWHLYAVERCLALRKKGYSIYAVPVEAYHRSPGYSMSPEYYTTMGAIMKKHRVPVVWTSLGFSTPYLPLGLQRRLKEFLMRL